MTTITSSDHGLLVDTRLDPLVNPNGCSSHVHSVYGNAQFGAVLDPRTLQDANWRNTEGKENQTTSEIIPNLSMYWAPSLYIRDPATRLYHLVPSFARIYYRIFHPDGMLHDRSTVVNPFPPNLRMIVGDASRKREWQESDTNRDNIKWTLKTWNRQAARWHSEGDWTYLKNDPTLVNASLDEIEMNLNFPDCLQVDDNGRPVTTSRDFRSHADYTRRWNEDLGNYCPDDFPYQVPRLNMEVRYKLNPMREKLGAEVVQNVGNWRLSTGDASGAGGHADFVNGWPVEMMKLMIDGCSNSRSISGNPVRCILEQYNLNGRIQKSVPYSVPIPQERVEVVATLPKGNCPPGFPPIKTASPTRFPTQSPSLMPTPIIGPSLPSTPIWKLAPDFVHGNPDNVWNLRRSALGAAAVFSPSWCSKGERCLQLTGPVAFASTFSISGPRGTSPDPRIDVLVPCFSLKQLKVEYEFTSPSRNIFDSNGSKGLFLEAWTSLTFQHVPTVAGHQSIENIHTQTTGIQRGETIFTVPPSHVLNDNVVLRFLFLSATNEQIIYVDNIRVYWLDTECYH